MSNYPAEFLRGLSNSDCIIKDKVNQQAFIFDDKVRIDGYRESSINWYDNNEALQIVLNQRKDNKKIQFKAGIAVLELNKLKIILRKELDRRELKYERQPLDNNKYHGNLLVKSDLSRQEVLRISWGLSLIVEDVIPQTNT